MSKRPQIEASESEREESKYEVEIGIVEFQICTKVLSVGGEKQSRMRLELVLIHINK